MEVRVRISSSISNFKPKLLAYLKVPEWNWWKDRNKPTVFFGLYHYRDYLRFIWHRGPKKVFWCGSDILALEKHPIWYRFIMKQKAFHYVENDIEKDRLWDITYNGWWGIRAKIRPMLFDDPDKYQISYKWSENPKYFATYHKERGEEYGLHKDLDNIDFFEGLSEEVFDKKIKEYQGAVRFNEFDGFAETLAKSALMGQYPISRIKYPYILHFSDARKTNELPKEPNYEASNYWRKTLKENKDEVINNW
jgi:hypothetical protein